ncbi:hypothetical protein QF91_004838 [Salmonella enterica subsp. salamae]|nr:hypothetical protein [Salmonella enterica subsp. salamae]ECI4078912.1 hypothetical protein [Salmonella enterica subsp. salamae]EDH0696492.1 hypothetical protein [Salmonella enterica]EDV0905558.1 hypothetical protein [Salmonella enterica subsp. salamae]
MPIAARLGDKGTRHDGYYETVIIAGSPIPSPYRAFARDLRTKIWKKLLGDAAGEYSDFLEIFAGRSIVLSPLFLRL